MKETGRKAYSKQTLASKGEAKVTHQEAFVLILCTPYSDLLKYFYLCSHLFLMIFQ